MKKAPKIYISIIATILISLNCFVVNIDKSHIDSTNLNSNDIMPCGDSPWI